MYKHFKLIIGILAVCLITLAVLFITDESRQQKHSMAAFLQNHYSAQNCDNYTILMSGDLEVTNRLYQKKYEKLITKDAFNRMVASRVVLESEKAVKENGCTISVEHIFFQKVKSIKIEGNRFYNYTVQAKLNFSDNEFSIVNLTGLITLEKQNEKWIISRFTPREFLAKAAEAK